MSQHASSLTEDPLQSAVDSSFWAELTTLKLQKLKLSEDNVNIKGIQVLLLDFKFLPGFCFSLQKFLDREGNTSWSI